MSLEEKVNELSARVDKQEAIIRLLCEKTGVSAADLGAGQPPQPAAPPKVRMSKKPAEKPDEEQPPAPVPKAKRRDAAAPSSSEAPPPVPSKARSDAPAPAPPPKAHRGATQLWDNKGPAKDFTVPTAPSPQLIPPKSECTYDGLAEPVIHESMKNFMQGCEYGVMWSFDPYTNKWEKSKCCINIDKTSFAAGAVRKAFKMQNLAEPGTLFVAKFSKQPDKDPRESYYADVEMIAHCSMWARKFNERGAPKPVTFLKAWVIELIDRTGKFNICGVEPFIEGEYQKHSNNSGSVMGDRNTPQTFSHFTYEESKHEVVVVDIQGVDDVYTDPQLHTRTGKGYGVGNLGSRGIDKWKSTHKCNSVCAALGLPGMGLDSRAAKRKMFRGTMMFPSLQMVEDTAPKEEEKEKKTITATGTLKEVAQWKAHTNDCTSVVYNKFTDQVITGGRDGNIATWDVAEKEEKSKMRNTRDVEALLLVNQQTIASGDREGQVKLWDLEKATEKSTFARGHSNEVKALVQATDDENIIVSSSMDKLLKVWDCRTSKEVAKMEGHERGVKALTISAACLFSGSNDDTIKLWDLKQHKFVYNLEGHQKYVSSLLVKGTTLFSGSADETIKCTNTLGKDGVGAVHAMAFHGGYLVSGGESNALRTWAAGSGFTENVLGHAVHSGLWNLLWARGCFFGAGFDGSLSVFTWQ